MHRDLKLANILSQSHCTKICDLGSARQIQPKSYLRELSTHVTTRLYRAPEQILFESHYDEKVDIWALGVIYGQLKHDEFLTLSKGGGFPLPKNLDYRCPSKQYTYRPQQESDTLTCYFDLFGTTADTDWLTTAGAKEFIGSFDKKTCKISDSILT